jgi:hypothetical protein
VPITSAASRETVDTMPYAKSNEDLEVIQDIDVHDIRVKMNYIKNLKKIPSKHIFNELLNVGRNRLHSTYYLDEKCLTYKNEAPIHFGQGVGKYNDPADCADNSLNKYGKTCSSDYRTNYKRTAEMDVHL